VKLGILFSELLKPAKVAQLYLHKYQEIAGLKQIQSNPTSLLGITA